jgi:transposase
MNSTKATIYTYFIGVDISRDKLDIAVMSGSVLLFHREIKNDPNDILIFIRDLKTLPKFVMTRAVFCMEATGIYCNPLLNTLKKFHANAVRENPLQILNSTGAIRGKNDKVDAIRIANYAYKNRHELKLKTPRRHPIEQLAHLSALRRRLVATVKALKTPLKEQQVFIPKNINKEVILLCNNSLVALANDIQAVNDAIAKVISDDDHIRRLNEIITSVPNVGAVTALQIIIATNELRDFNNPKKFACYAGIAPFGNESGTHKGKTRVSHLANKEIKALLHLCAIGAIRGNPEIKAYFVRKTQKEGKAKMLVVNAVRFKLVLRIFACLNQNRCYVKDYKRSDNSINLQD